MSITLAKLPLAKVQGNDFIHPMPLTIITGGGGEKKSGDY